MAPRWMTKITKTKLIATLTIAILNAPGGATAQTTPEFNDALATGIRGVFTLCEDATKSRCKELAQSTLAELGTVRAYNLHAAREVLSERLSLVADAYDETTLKSIQTFANLDANHWGSGPDSIEVIDHSEKDFLGRPLKIAVGLPYERFRNELTLGAALAAAEEGDVDTADQLLSPLVGKCAEHTEGPQIPARLHADRGLFTALWRYRLPTARRIVHEMPEQCIARFASYLVLAEIYAEEGNMVATRELLSTIPDDIRHKNATSIALTEMASEFVASCKERVKQEPTKTFSQEPCLCLKREAYMEHGDPNDTVEAAKLFYGLYLSPDETYFALQERRTEAPVSNPLIERRLRSRGLAATSRCLRPNQALHAIGMQAFSLLQQ